ncbi:MAG: hypothetical protein ABIB47_01130 [Candidatus Woesearchaeota archaeon]
MVLKPIYIIIVLLLLFLTSISAEEDIHDFMEDVDSSYLIVLGEESPGSDSLAAIDINQGLEDLDLNAVLENEITTGNKLILLGNPCENSKITLGCHSWPFEEGQALIKVDGLNLIVTGTTSEDIRKAAKVLSEYKDYNLLKSYSEVLVTGTLQNPEIEILGAQQEEFTEIKIICGDAICAEDEKQPRCVNDYCEYSCIEDCSVPCGNNICEEEFKEDSENCPADCKIETEKSPEGYNQAGPSKKEGFWSRLIEWFKNLFF